MSTFKTYLNSSIGKKQVVAVSGVALVIFIILHLIGNLLIFKGPELFNTYAHALHSMGRLLQVMEIGLFLTFSVHIIFTIALIIENKNARGRAYAVTKNKNRSFATQTMRYTGPLVLFFLILHLLDFTWSAPWPKTSIVNGQDLATYGMVFNALLNPMRAVVYIAAVCSLGFHLSHGVQSVFQSFGVVSASRPGPIRTISKGLGYIIAIGFSSIPLYINYIHYSGALLCHLQ
ncbi:MAG: succinate dehydrogenase cytochrome b subunit [Candidatus Margulisbacteria bacterium]|nr:succinate dehydrogenase cytochrome b subunit [Candidatus Margulisiibacteriota bacterium]